MPLARRCFDLTCAVNPWWYCRTTTDAWCTQSGGQSPWHKNGRTLWFKVRAEAEKKHCIALSSNYACYADMSHRVMTLLPQLTPRVEVNSIDETFVT